MEHGKGRALLQKVASPRMTLLLMLMIALAAAVGTLLPRNLSPEAWQQQYGTGAPWWQSLGLDRYYASWWFRSLWGGLLINLLACGVRRSLLATNDLFGRGRPLLRLPLADREHLLSLLRAAGFRIRSTSPLYARRRLYAFSGFPLVHLCPALIVAGSLWGSLAGYVGTTYGFPRKPTWTFFNWSAGTDQNLPFVLVVEDIRQQWYPLQLQVGVGEKGSGGRVVETRVGGRFRVPSVPYEVEISDLDIRTKDLFFYLHGDRGREGPYSSVRRDSPLRVVPVAYRDREVRQVEADLTVRGADGAVLASHALAVNRPLQYAGVRVYLTAWSRDLGSDPWVGLQIVADPGQWLVWSGAAGLSLGVLLLVFVRGGWVREEGADVLVKADRALLKELRRVSGPRAPG